MNKLNKTDPKMDPWGTPETVNRNRRFIPLMRVDCCLSER